MEKHICYNEEEFKERVDFIYDRLNEVASSLAMISQQLDGERTNMTSGYIKANIIPEMNKVIDVLNDFNLGTKKLLLNIDIKRKGLEEIMKQDIY